MLTVLSEVELKLRENDEVLEVVNSGNIELNVDVYDDGTLVDNFELVVDESENVSGTLVFGGKNE
jgi:hypothetical protein